MKCLSIVIPVLNEEKNISLLYKELGQIGRKIPYVLELIFVDDGSTDGSVALLKKLQNKDKRVKLVEFTSNFGQTAAFDAGIKMAHGEVIATVDSDLQNDPADIPQLLKKLDSGFDVVCGWRVKREDTLEKRAFSFLANFLRRKLTGETIHDSGCSLRVYKKEVFTGIDLYGEMHRFIPAILTLRGYKIGEVPVHHRKRRFGKSKYGTIRLLKGLLDLLFIVFLLRFSAKPLHIFGTIGVLIFLGGFVTSVYLTILKIFFGVMLSNRPLLTLAVLLMVLGTQFFIFGILAEILIRIYFKTHSFTPYTIRSKTL
jgi:glycosyltransferase involved in cell wall biosynthesis